jgi:citrate lyase beta subunit
MPTPAEFVKRWKNVRVLFESPILNDYKWAKIPSIPADAFILDLEDSVPDDRKEEARDKVVEYLRQPEYFNGAIPMPRVNHLSTPWGRDDVIALAEAGVEQMMYPKTESVDDVTELLELCRQHGASPVLKPSIESALGVVNVDSIAAMDEVVCLGCGVGDLHVDTGQPLYEEDGSLFPGHYYPKLKTVMACCAYDKAKIGFPQLPNLKDLDEYRRRAITEKRVGFNGCSTFYPPHVQILLDVFTVSESEISEAQQTVDLFEEARAKGDNAVQRSDGSALLIHQYKEAKALLDRAADNPRQPVG